MGRDFGDLREQTFPGEQEVVVVARVAGPFALLVSLEDPHDLLFERQKVRGTLRQDLGETAAGVDGEGVEVGEDIPLGEAFLERLDLQVGRRRIENLAGVLFVQDREVGREPDAAPEPPQEPAPDRVERASHEPARVDREEHLDPTEHLPGRLVCERQQHDAGRVGARFDQPRDPVDERACLARPRARDDEDRPPAREHDRFLLFVQLPVVVDPIGPGSDLRPEYVFLNGVRSPLATLRVRSPLATLESNFWACSSFVTGFRR